MKSRSAAVTTLVALVSVGIFGVAPALAAPGDLDPSFGNGGVVTTDWSANDSIEDIAIYPLGSPHAGKIVAVGEVATATKSQTFGVARYNPDGTLDAAFGTDGLASAVFDSGFGSRAFSVALQDDDKIVLAGNVIDTDPQGVGNDFGLARFNSDGSLDGGFGRGGMVRTDFASHDDVASGIAIQSDGKIVAVGQADELVGSSPRGRFAVARYNADGSPDIAFGLTDSLTLGGKVITRFPESGSSRCSCGGGTDVKLQPDGKIIAAGSWDLQFALVRYRSDGSLDQSFGAQGRVTTNFDGDNRGGENINAIALQDDGKIVATGTYSGVGPTIAFALARYNPDGSLDPTFGSGGTVITDVTPAFEVSPGNFNLGGEHALDVAVQRDGRIVVTGYTTPDQFRIVLVRYGSEGSLDPAFGSGGVVVARIDQSSLAASLALQPDGSIIVGGSTFGFPSDFLLARYSVALSDPGDLTVTNIDAPDPIRDGEELTYTITVTNLGPTTLTGVTITDSFVPSEVRFIRASSSCTKKGSTLACSVGALEREASSTVTVTVAPRHSSSTVTNTATVTSADSDPHPANNSATATTQVS